MFYRDTDNILHSSDKQYKAELDMLLNQILEIESQIAEHYNVINSAALSSKETDIIEKHSQEIALLKSRRTYFEFSIFMTYELKNRLDKDDGNDEQRKKLIKEIKSRNTLYWEK